MIFKTHLFIINRIQFVQCGGFSFYILTATLEALQGSGLEEFMFPNFIDYVTSANQ